MNIRNKLKKMIKNVKRNNRLKRTETIREISYDRLKELIKVNKDIVIVDIRSPQEFNENRIKYAINIPLYELDKNYAEMLPDKNQLIIFYCTSGVRSKKAYEMLAKKGYTNIYSLTGGLDAVF